MIAIAEESNSLEKVLIDVPTGWRSGPPATWN